MGLRLIRRVPLYGTWRHRLPPCSPADETIVVLARSCSAMAHAPLSNYEAMGRKPGRTTRRRSGPGTKAPFTRHTTVKECGTSLRVGRPWDSPTPAPTRFDLGNGIEAVVSLGAKGIERDHGCESNERPKRAASPPAHKGTAPGDEGSPGLGHALTDRESLSVVAKDVSSLAAPILTPSTAMEQVDITSLVADLESAKTTASAAETTVAADYRVFMEDALPVLLASSVTSSGQACELALQMSALHSLHRTLSWVEEGTRRTGRRYEPAFPVPLVAALWDVMPAHVQMIENRLALRRSTRTLADAVCDPNVDDSCGQQGDGLQRLTVEGGRRRLAKALRSARRSLALRTRAVADLLPPQTLVLVLARMQQCGALSDDVLGPIGSNLLRGSFYRFISATEERAIEVGDPLLQGPQPTARNFSLLAHMVAARPEKVDSLPFQHAVALTFIRILGRQAAPEHFQLHRLVHTVLLPAIQQDLADAAEATVSASQQGGDSTVRLLNEETLLDVTRCFVRYAVSGSAVQHLTTLWVPYVSQFGLSECCTLLRLCSQPPSVTMKGGNRALGHLVRRRKGVRVGEEDYIPLVEALCAQVERCCGQYLRTLEDPSAPPSMDPPSAVVLMETVQAVLCVNSVRWAEVYLLAATALLARLQRDHNGHSSADGLETNWPLRPTEKLVKALLHRNTAIPDHPLHRGLLLRLLYAPEAQREAGLASTVFTGLALMTDTGAADQVDCRSPTQDAPPTTELPTQVPDTVTALLQEDIDTAVALGLFNKHSSALSLSAFVAAMCVVPLQHLPVSKQSHVVQHFTSLASAVHPRWLAKGIAAAVAKMPAAVDPVSVQRWYSRYTATDVVQQIDVMDCAGLLWVLSGNENYKRDCALAMRAIVRRVGAVLRTDDGRVGALEAVPQLVDALHKCNVFFSYLYSRMCRLLLSQVERGPWEVVLPAFHAAAEEYTRRPRGEGAGTVFRDAWEILRGRLVDEAAASLSLVDVVKAFKGFAALDGHDRPVFLVLTHRLWAEVRRKALDDGDGKRREENSALARVGEKVLQMLTPSAVAVLASTLLHLGNGDDVNTLLPWVLVTLQKNCNELYPVDVLQILPSLLNAFASVEASVADASLAQERKAGIPTAVTNWSQSPMNQQLLHRVYDECRSLFLLMYGVVEAVTDGTPQERSSEMQDILEKRALWDAKTTVSVNLVPKRSFVELLVALSNAGLRDEAMAVACAERACTRRVCRETLAINELVHMCMSLCFQMVHPYGDKAADAIEASPAKESSGKRGLAVVLSALWERVDECTARHIDALLRCLRHYYGNKVDEDFVERLEKQKQTLAQREVVATREAAATPPPSDSNNSAEEPVTANATRQAGAHHPAENSLCEDSHARGSTAVLSTSDVPLASDVVVTLDAEDMFRMM